MNKPKSIIEKNEYSTKFLDHHQANDRDDRSSTFAFRFSHSTIAKLNQLRTQLTHPIDLNADLRKYTHFLHSEKIDNRNNVTLIARSIKRSRNLALHFRDEFALKIKSALKKSHTAGQARSHAVKINNEKSRSMTKLVGMIVLELVMELLPYEAACASQHVG